MPIVQNVKYFITEWDGTDNPVMVKSVGGRTVRRRADGSRYMVTGGDVLMKYSNGIVHRVSYKYFLSLKPRLSFIAPLN